MEKNLGVTCLAQRLKDSMCVMGFEPVTLWFFGGSTVHSTTVNIEDLNDFPMTLTAEKSMFFQLVHSFGGATSKWTASKLNIYLGTEVTECTVFKNSKCFCDCQLCV